VIKERKHLFFSSFWIALFLFSFVQFVADDFSDRHEIMSLSQETDLKTLFESFPIDPLMAEVTEFILLSIKNT
jgi:hypothetical protein